MNNSPDKVRDKSCQLRKVSMQPALKLLIPILIVSLIALLLLFSQYKQSPTQSTQSAQPIERSIPKEFYKSPILGGFSIGTPEKVAKAATDGVQVAFQYGQPPSESGSLGKILQSLHMKVIDGYLWNLLYYYECHRTKTVKPPPSGQEQYCQNDNNPSLTDENALLASVAAHLKQVRNSQLITGYWILDDWAPWDAGSARQILIKIHNLIQQYTPDRSAICGFGGSIGQQQKYEWADWLADNFSPQGCDKVGFYIYTSSLSDISPPVSQDAYNWSMSGILPAMFASLQRRGWDITKEQLIGIGQAFGGPRANTDRYWVTPNAKDIEIQSRSFCEHGATGLTFYAWDDSAFGPTTQTPMNSSEIKIGIRNGIAACKQYWSKQLRA